MLAWPPRMQRQVNWTACLSPYESLRAGSLHTLTWIRIRFACLALKSYLFLFEEHTPDPSTQSFLSFHLSKTTSVKPCVTPAQIPNARRLFCHVHASTTREETFHRLSLKSLGEALHVVLQRAVVGQELHVGTVNLDTASSLLLQVLVATEGGEAPVLGDNDLLATGELVLGAAEGLKSSGLV